MSELEPESLRLVLRIEAAIDDAKCGQCMEALSHVLVSLFMQNLDFAGMSRERAFMVFAQQTFCRLKDAIDAGEHLSNRMQ